MRTVTCSLVLAGVFLAGAPLAQVIKLNDRLSDVPPESVISYRITPDGAFAVFNGDQGEGPQLHVVPVDGSTAPRPLGSALVNGQLKGYRISPDGASVVFGKRMADSSQRLYRVPVTGGTPIRLTAGEGVVGISDLEPAFQIDASSQHVVYRGHDGLGLYSVLLDGSAAPVRLDAAGPAGPVEADFALTPDGARVLFRAEISTPFAIDLHSVPVDGSSPARRLNLTRPGCDVSEFVVAHDSLGVAYAADQETDEMFELYVVPVDGSSAPVKRSETLLSGFDVGHLAFAAADDRLLYRVGPSPRRLDELFSVDAIAGGTPVRLSLPRDVELVFAAEIDASGQHVLYGSSPTSGHGSESFAVASDGTGRQDFPLSGFGRFARFGARVLFEQASLPFDSQLVLASAPIDGNGAPVRLDDLPQGAVFANLFLDLPDGTLVYSALPSGAAQWGLHRVPIDGSAPSVRLGPNLASGQELTDVQATPAGDRLLFKIDGVLHSMPSTGGPARQLSRTSSGPIVGEIRGFQLSPDGAHVLYLGEEGSARAEDLLCVPSDGSSGSIRLDRPHFSANLASGLTFSSDGAWVAYQHAGQLFSARPGERASARVLAPSGSYPIRILPDGATVLFQQDLDQPGLPRGLGLVVLDGGSPPAPLELSFFQPGSAFALAPDGRWIAYLMTIPSAPAQLAVAPLDGSTEPVDLATTSGAFAFTPDSSRVVYVRTDLNRLYVQARDGSTPGIFLSRSGVGSVTSFRVHPDGEHVVFFKTDNSTSEQTLWSAKLDGTGLVQLAGPIASSSWSGALEFEPGAPRVVYGVAPGFGQPFELRSSPLDGSAPARTLYAGAEPVVPVGGRASLHFEAGRVVFFTGPLSGVLAHSLRSAPLDGSTPAALLASGDLVRELELLPGGGGAVFAGALAGGSSLELLLAPLAGGPVRTLNAPLVAGGNVVALAPNAFRVTPDGEHVIYLADQEEDGRVELYSAFLGMRGPRAGNRPTRTVTVTR